ncbi:MAG: iron ABC transporter permease [Deltaproteobacteria bacterium]|nr:iron ABC transporter permease [Deltaproteobacteria bacterium]
MAVLLPLLAIAVLLGLLAGAHELSLSRALSGLDPDATVLHKLRLPRVALAALVGAALSVAGVALQALLRNPLADPFVFGLSGGAAIGIALSALLPGAVIATAGALTGVGLLPQQLFACAGACGAAIFIFAIGRSGGQLVPERALLVGVVFNSFASAFVIGLQAVVLPEKTQAILLWLSGTLGYETWSALTAAAVFVLVPTVALITLSGRLNLLQLGDEAAMSLGVDVARVRAFSFLCASAIVGAAVALTGLVGFVGLVVPHAVRLLVGGDHRVLLPTSAIGGAIFLVLCDAAARLMFRPFGIEPPVGAVTALLGAPMFVLLLKRRGRV